MSLFMWEYYSRKEVSKLNLSFCINMTVCALKARLYKHANPSIIKMVNTLVKMFNTLKQGPLFFFLFWPPPWHVEFQGQGSDPSHSYSNARSFNPLCWARDQTCVPVLQRHHQSHCTTSETLK